jgi:hypothetical protein
MKHQNSQTDVASTLTAISNPLAKKYRKMRLAIEAMSDAEIQSALYIIDKFSPLDLEDADFCEAEHILRKEVDRENSKRIAKNAPWLKVTTEGDNAGRHALCVAHDVGIALWKEFATEAEANAAADAVFEFLQAEGRAANYLDPNPGGRPEKTTSGDRQGYYRPDTDEIPF